MKFYHFTKIGGVGDDMTERYAGSNAEVFEVWNWYKRELKKKHVLGIPKGFWHFKDFGNGMPIPKRVREFYRSREDLMAFFDDPFDVEGNSFFNWIGREEPYLLA